mmetsp:Transcript_44414/g.139258  ORF Transcript_44414/g.139258 Transcript_44414/m.139258 type:complete len:207 (+) Transcript_44414:244-864(+)
MASLPSSSNSAGPPRRNIASSCSAGLVNCLPLLHSNAARISRPALGGGGRRSAASASGSCAPPLRKARSSRPASLPGSTRVDRRRPGFGGSGACCPAVLPASGAALVGSSGRVPRGRPHISQGLLAGWLRKVHMPHSQSQALGCGRAGQDDGLLPATAPGSGAAAWALGHIRAGAMTAQEPGLAWPLPLGCSRTPTPASAHEPLLT